MSFSKFNSVMVQFISDNDRFLVTLSANNIFNQILKAIIVVAIEEIKCKKSNEK